jgi:hypothetical protein
MLSARLRHALANLHSASGNSLASLTANGFDHPAFAEASLPPAIGLPTSVDLDMLLATADSPFSADAEDVAFTLVSFGVRPLMLEHGPEPALLALAGHARLRGLSTLFGPFAFDIERDSRRRGYSNRSSVPRKAVRGSGGWRSLLISPDPELACLAWLALAAGWDRLLGRLLGYPACCSDFFERHWPNAWNNYQGDLGSMLLSSYTTPFRTLPWRTNIFARYQAPCLVAHFPCRFDCTETEAEARDVEACLQHFRPDLAIAARAAMRGVVYEDNEGVRVLPGARLRPDGTLLVPGDASFADVRVARNGLTRGGVPVADRLAAFTAEDVD